MAKQIILHYAGSYVERPHTITFDSEREYEKFIQEKGYRLKPNVEYGVFTLDAILKTQFQQSSIEIEDVNEADKPDIPTITPPTIDIKYPQCGCASDKEDNKGSDNNININITIPGLENITTNQGNVNVGTGNNQGCNDTQPKDDEGDNPTTPPADNQEENQEGDVVVIGGDGDNQNPTEGTDTGTTNETQNENQGTDEGFNRVGPVVSFGGGDGEESQTENIQDGGDSQIIIPDEGNSGNTSPEGGDEDIIVL